MQIEVQGRRYDFDADKLTIREARTLKEHGLTVRGLFSMLALSDPDATVAVVFLAKKRAGEAVRWGDFDDLDYSEVEIIVDDEDDEDDDSDGEGEQRKDPQTASDGSSGGTTPSDGSTST